MKLRKILLASTLSMALAITAAVPAFAETGEAVPISADADMPIMVQSQNIKTVLPKLTAKSYSYSKNKLSWDAVSGAGGYEVFRATSKTGKFQKVSAIAAEKTSYINTGLTCGKTYWYKLRAYQVKNGKKVYSKYSDVKSTYPKPSKVKDASVKFSNRDFVGFEINWKKTNGADGYQLQFKPGNGKWSTYYREYNSFTKRWENTYPDEFKGKKERFNVKYIVLGTEASWATGYSEDSYSFRVRAYKTVSGKKVYGKWSKEQTAKEKITAENIDYIFETVQENVKAWAKKNYPNFVVADEREGAWDEAAGEYPGYAPEGGTYYISGSQRNYFSRYASPEAVIDYLTQSYEDYIEEVTFKGGNESAYLFIRKMRNGSPRGLGSPYDGTAIYFVTWILVCF